MLNFITDYLRGYFSAQPHLIQTPLHQDAPYKGWKLYFSEGEGFLYLYMVQLRAD